MDELKALQLVSQGGSLVLLGFIVLWLTRWIPKRMDRADEVKEQEAKSREEVAKINKESVSKLADTHSESQKAMLKEFRDQQQYEREVCEKRHYELMVKIDERFKEVLDRQDRNHEILREVNHGIRNVLHERATVKVAEEIKAKRGVRGPSSGEPGVGDQR
jgi:hypothetical protein